MKRKRINLYNILVKTPIITLLTIIICFVICFIILECQNSVGFLEYVFS